MKQILSSQAGTEHNNDDDIANLDAMISTDPVKYGLAHYGYVFEPKGSHLIHTIDTSILALRLAIDMAKIELIKEATAKIFAIYHEYSVDNANVMCCLEFRMNALIIDVKLKLQHPWRR